MNRFKNIFITLIAALVAFLAIPVVSVSAHHYDQDEEETPEVCTPTEAPEPTTFEKNIAKFGTVNATYKWFDEGDHYQLKIDIDPQGGENHRDWINAYPEGWQVLFKKPVDLPKSIVKVTCQSEEVPTTNAPQSSSQSGPSGPPACTDTVPGDIPIVWVENPVSADGKLTLRWWVNPGLSYVSIRYTETPGVWRYGIPSGPNDGEEVIDLLDNNSAYYFQVVGFNGCAGSNWIESFNNLKP